MTSPITREPAGTPRRMLTVVALTLAGGALLATALIGGDAKARDGEPSVERYQLQRTESGFARIDTQTGEVSTCTERGEQLVCRMAADERSALIEKIDELEERVVALEGSGVGRALPSDAEMDRAIGLMERFMRGFVGIVRDLDEPQRGS